MIELTHVSKDFGKGQQEVHAVRDVSLSIDKGEIFGIIGFSGAGKSTLVRCINLLERPTAGTVMVDNKDLTALSARELRQARKKIGMIFQHFNLMPSRTVAGNVAYSMPDVTLAVINGNYALDSGLTPDAVLTDAEEALESIGELTGRTAKEEIVGAVFSRFCVGK